MKTTMDISIKAIEKVVKKPKDIEAFLNSYVTIYEKVDGVKVQLYLKPDASNDKDVDENWIVAYKGSIIVSGEHDYADEEDIKNTIGSSQFKFIFDKLKTINVDAIPKGYQYFCEYLIKKQTLMAKYTKLYELILLSYGKSNCYVKNGRLICDNTDFNFDEQEREKLAKTMGIHTPLKVFEGELYPYENLVKGALIQDLKVALADNEVLKTTTDLEIYYKEVINTFLAVESEFGGLPEGYVVYGFKDYPVKFQQTYQLSKEERQKLKNQYRGTMLEEGIYWAEVKKIANKIASELDLKQPIQKLLKEIAQKIKALPKDVITHPKKNWSIIKDDIQVTAKIALIEAVADKYTLFIGKVRILTNAHKKLIDTALKNGGCVIALTVNKDTKKTLELRKSMIEACYSKEIKSGKLEIITTQSGYLPTILNKTVNIIGQIVAGTDRIPDYQEQIENIGKNIKVIEFQRSADDISATKVIENLENKDYFEKNTPKCIHKMYDVILKTYKGT